MLIKVDESKNKRFKLVYDCNKAYNLVKLGFKNVLFAIIETKLTENAKAIVIDITQDLCWLEHFKKSSTRCLFEEKNCWAVSIGIPVNKVLVRVFF